MPKIDFERAVTAEAKDAAEKVALRDRIRQRRDQAIKAGVSFGGVVLHTDDVSQQRIYGAAFAAMRDPGLVVKWKSADGGYVDLGSEAVLAAADAVRAHVQACFDREADLLAQIDEGLSPDALSGWPAGSGPDAFE